MQSMLRATLAAVLAVALIHIATVAPAQSPVQSAVKQIRLTEKQVQGFIAAQKEVSAVLEQIQGATAAQLPPQLQAALDAVARKHGFKDFAEYDNVVDNITIVMAGIDPQTKEFTEEAIRIKKEIEDIKADKSIPDNEKKPMLEMLDELLKRAVPLQYPSNVELVRKYYDKIDAALT